MIDKPFGHKITQLMQVTLKSIIIFLYNKELVHPQKLNWVPLEFSSEDTAIDQYQINS